MSDEFVERVTRRAAQYAKHRNSATLEASDLRLCLERHWGIEVPGPAKRIAPWTYRRPTLPSAPPAKKPRAAQKPIVVDKSGVPGRAQKSHSPMPHQQRPNNTPPQRPQPQRPAQQQQQHQQRPKLPPQQATRPSVVVAAAQQQLPGGPPS